MNIYPSQFEDLFESHPLTLVDVGASGGLMPLWAPHQRHLRVIGFEPDERAFEALRHQQNRLKHYLNIGLHRDSGEYSFYLTRKQKNSSCFLPNRTLLDRFPDSGRFDVMGETKIQCQSLDGALADAALTDIDFINLDTQGTELNILRGATAALSNALFGLEIEIAFAELYQGQPLFADVDQFVRQHGFDLINLRTGSRKRAIGADVGNSKGQLLSGDALYFRQPLNLQQALEKADPEVARSKLLRALAICQIYGFLDCGLELLDVMGSDIFDGRQVRYLQKHIRAQAPLAARMPNFPGRKWMARRLLGLSKWMAPRPVVQCTRYLPLFPTLLINIRKGLLFG